MALLVDAILLPIVWGYVILAQSSKVEESFNIQAIHDILNYGLEISKYDHLEFPGVVPRTFLGAIVIAAMTKPWLMVFPPAFTKFDGQIMARSMLGLVNAVMIIYLKNAVYAAIKTGVKLTLATATEKVSKSRKGSVKKHAQVAPVEEYKPWSFGLWFTLFVMVQFHLPFYMTRTLPNFFALPLTNYAFAQMFKRNYERSISVLAFTAVVFRVEIVALMLALGFSFVMYNKLSIPQLIRPAIIGGITGIVLSAPVDSFFWQRYTVPEIESFIFNVIEGKSAEWGTEPFSQYFTKYFLTMFLPPHVPVLAVLGYFVDPTKGLLRVMGLSSFIYVLLVSFQPHKEWRFIVYVIPLITAMAANGAAFVTSRFSKSFLYKLGVLIIFGSACVSMLVSIVFATVSSYNYPGGDAMTKFNELIMMKMFYKKIDPLKPITVHLDTLACMTGVTHFSEIDPESTFNVTYDRTEDPEVLAPKWETFDYLITETDISKNYKGDVIPYLEDWRWKKLESIKAFDGLDMKGFKYLDPVNIALNMYFQKSPKPFFVAISKFVHQKDALFIYEKVPAPVQKKEEEETVAEPDVEVEVDNESAQYEDAEKVAGYSGMVDLVVE